MKKIIKNTFDFCNFLTLLIKYKSFKNNLNKTYTGKAVVLANGPSLKEIIPTLDKETRFLNVDYIVLNYFANQNVFFSIKPIHYCLSDPMFFINSNRTKEAKELYKILNEKVDWEMNLYIPKGRYKDFEKFSGLNNAKINVIQLNTIPYMGYEKFRHFFYRKGLAMPVIGTVANMAIFTGINLGYNSLDLYGVDHTFFDSLTVNSNNEACNRMKHFYNESEPELIPIRKVVGGKVFKVSEYIRSINLMFQSHDLLSIYAKRRSVKIKNLTKGSLIDSYDRD